MRSPKPFTLLCILVLPILVLIACKDSIDDFPQEDCYASLPDSCASDTAVLGYVAKQKMLAFCDEWMASACFSCLCVDAPDQGQLAKASFDKKELENFLEMEICNDKPVARKYPGLKVSFGMRPGTSCPGLILEKVNPDCMVIIPDDSSQDCCLWSRVNQPEASQILTFAQLATYSETFNSYLKDQNQLSSTVFYAPEYFTYLSDSALSLMYRPPLIEEIINPVKGLNFYFGSTHHTDSVDARHIELFMHPEREYPVAIEDEESVDFGKPCPPYCNHN